MRRKSQILGPQTMNGQGRGVSDHEAREAREIVRRAAKRLTREALAKRLEVSTTAIWMWLENGRAPSRDAFKRIVTLGREIADV